MNKTQTSSVAVQEQSPKPRRLGRGLSALLGDPVAVQVPSSPAISVVEPKSQPSVPRVAPAPIRGARQDASVGEVGDSEASGLVQMELSSAEPNRFQPRRTFDEAQLKDLASSIRTAGVVQPILVRPLGGGRYEIVAGERRWRACKLAGLTHVPAVVSALSDEQAAEWALIENIQRTDLSPMERAWAVRGLCDRFGLTHTQVGDKLGMDRSSAANLARLTDLEKEIQDLLDQGQLTAGHGKVLVGLPPGPVRVGLSRQAAGQGWSVRRLEQAAARAAQAPTGPAPEIKIGEQAISKAAAMKDLERQLSEHLGTSVRIRANAGAKRGSLVIKFFDLDHFDGLMSKIGFVLR
jgi:ParB family chromosome partitioning protein